jgi:hypothetical protein
LLEVYVILDYFGTFWQYIYGRNRINGCLHHLTMDKRLTQEDIDYINLTAQMEEKERYTKKVLNKLKAIKVKVTGQNDRECFCSQIRRKIWYREFTNWHESNS